MAPASSPRANAGPAPEPLPELSPGSNLQEAAQRYAAAKRRDRHRPRPSRG